MNIYPPKIIMNIGIPEIWNSVAQVLEKLMSHKEINVDVQRFFQNFNAKKIPVITIMGYIERLRKYCRCSDSCILTALIYIKRILRKYSQVELHTLNVHRYNFLIFRIIISALLVAIKYSEDICFTNKFYAEIGAISCEELAKLETEFILLLDFDLHVLPELFEDHLKDLIGTDSIIEQKMNKSLRKNWSKSSMKTINPLSDISTESNLSNLTLPYK